MNNRRRTFIAVGLAFSFVFLAFVAGKILRHEPIEDAEIFAWAITLAIGTSIAAVVSHAFHDKDERTARERAAKLIRVLTVLYVAVALVVLIVKALKSI